MYEEHLNLSRDFSAIAFVTRPDGHPLEWGAIKCCQWEGIRAQYRRLPGPIKYDFSISGNFHRFVLLDIYREDGETILGDGTRITDKDLRDRFVYTGPSCHLSGWSRIEAAGSFVMVEVADDDTEELSDVEPIFKRADTFMRSVLMQFKSLLVGDSSPVPDYAETLAVMLRQELRRIAVMENRREGDGCGLTPRQLKATLAYMDDRIDQGVSIAKMAKNLDMSAFHFIRMFKKTVGLPPHQFFLTRRIDRAKELLRSPDLSIADVAEMSGFGGTTQLTRTFRRIVGTNPTTFRRSIRQ